MSTKTPLTIEVNFYPRCSEELQGDPHLVVLEANGLMWKVGFYNYDYLCSMLATAVAMGWMPQVAAAAALDDVKQWLFDEMNQEAEPQRTDAPQQVSRTQDEAGTRLAGLFRWVRRVWLGISEAD